MPVQALTTGRTPPHPRRLPVLVDPRTRTRKPRGAPALLFCRNRCPTLCQGLDHSVIVRTRNQVPSRERLKTSVLLIINVAAKTPASFYSSDILQLGKPGD